jgi:hypothetical protein
VAGEASPSSAYAVTKLSRTVAESAVDCCAVEKPETVPTAPRSQATVVSPVFVKTPFENTAKLWAEPRETGASARLDSEIRKVAGITRVRATTVNIASLEDLLLRGRA